MPLTKASWELSTIDFIAMKHIENTWPDKLKDEEHSILLTMNYDCIEVCQNAWYIAFCIPRATLFNYKRRFLNGDTRLVNGNCGLEKPIHNILMSIVSL